MSANAEDTVLTGDVENLLELAFKASYKAKDNDPKNQVVINNCMKLVGRDYKYCVVSNYNGELCSHYPARIPILEYSCCGQDKNNVESLFDVSSLKDLFNKARFARCRGRFAVPVIIFEGKHICRSATISGGAEIYGRSGFDFFFTGGESIPMPDMETTQASAVGETNEWQLFNRIRGQDIKLLKTFSVSYIVDLMVEKKKVKFGMNVTSSEKVDKENRYADFTIMSVPYPGCEFFRTWRDNGYRVDDLNFDWKQGYVDALLDLPGRLSPPRSVDWTKYRSWDLVKLTQNYLKLLLHYIKNGNGGLLIHCISGWDRTPLFISLIRLSLWADGLIHQSLNSTEILYLTLSYDWYLFGHNLPDRIGKGEDIFFFCFFFLKYICSEDFSLIDNLSSQRSMSRTESECLMDSVLLEADILPGNKGSNSSLNSSCSVNSASADNPPLYFSVGSPEEDCFINGSSMCSKSPLSRHSRSSASRFSENHNVHMITHSSQSAVQYHATSPMAVPSAIQKHTPDTKNQSPNYGSWQMISGSGSLRGSSSTSSHGSHKSAPTEDPHSSEPSIFESSRRQRLETVRRTFLAAYSSLVPPGPDGVNSSSAISSILGNFAEKVGIKNTRSNVV